MSATWKYRSQAQAEGQRSEKAHDQYVRPTDLGVPGNAYQAAEVTARAGAEEMIPTVDQAAMLCFAIFVSGLFESHIRTRAGRRLRIVPRGGGVSVRDVAVGDQGCQATMPGE